MRPSNGPNDWGQIEGDPALFGLRYDDVVAIQNLSDTAQDLPNFEHALTLLGCELNAGEMPGYGFGWAAVG